MDTSLCYLYVLSNKRCKKKYIGITSIPHLRWEEHKEAAREGKDTPLYRAIRNYGVKSFTMHLMAQGPRWAMEHLEVAMIRHWKTQEPNGYNVHPGGKIRRKKK